MVGLIFLISDHFPGKFSGGEVMVVARFFLFAYFSLEKSQVFY